MDLTDRLKRGAKVAVQGAVSRIANYAAGSERTTDVLDAIVAARVGALAASVPIHDSVALARLLRECQEPRTHELRWIREGERNREGSGGLFETLAESLTSGSPPIALEDAVTVGLEADRLLGDRTPFDRARWSADVGIHARIASSFGDKGRLLATVVRIMRARTCLELGTGYGMSALFIATAQRRQFPDWRLVTVESSNPQYSVATEMLGRVLGDRARCLAEVSTKAIPAADAEFGPIDLVFHDAAHNRRAYIDDFAALAAVLPGGAAVLLDDIRWEDPRWEPQPPQTYEGWLAVAGHDRVRHAVEIDETYGLVLLR